MRETIKAVLAARPGVADWLLVELRKSGSEIYLIGDQTDISRAVESLNYTLLVYVDSETSGQQSRGEARVTLHPTMSEEEVARAVDRAIFAASRSRNPWYGLPEGAPPLVALPPGGFEGRSPASWAAELRDAILDAADPSKGLAERPGAMKGALASAPRLNSLELFLTKRETRILSSRGVDVGFSSHEGYIEYVVEAEGEAGEVELFDDLRFSEPDFDRIGGEIEGALALVGERAHALPLPALADLPLILGGKEAASVLAWFFDNADAGRMWLGSSPFALGASVHGDSARAGEYDPIELAAEAILRGHPASAPFDEEGVPLARHPLVQGGELRGLAGSSRYSSYLKLPVVGGYRLFSVGAGSLGLDAMRARPHLEVARFSDFNVDPDSGDFGGEIRLGWHFDGKRRVPISGGSVTGSLFENRGRLRMSSEIGLAGSMLGPRNILLPAVSITGAATGG